MNTILMFTNDVKPISIDYWLHKYPEVNIDFDQWLKMINMQKLGRRKSFDFNWRIFHRHVNTEIKLEQMKLSDGYCKLCNTARENLDHILIRCSHILDLWVRIEQIVYFLGETDYMTDFNKIIGYMKDGKLHEVINMIISLSRWMIWRRRCINRYEGEYIDVESLVKWILHEIKDHKRSYTNNNQM